MVEDMRFATEIEVCPIVRELDGLALSSRNRYLNPAERTQALVLSRALHRIEGLVAEGERRSCALIEAANQLFAAESEIRIDYITVVNWATLLPVEVAVPGSLFVIAAYVGITRLIDNTVIG
jgi:pantoate--beta-alanine ligase